MSQHKAGSIDFSITTATYERMEKYAVGFDDTPDKAINRLIDSIEYATGEKAVKQNPYKPDLSFHNKTEDEFQEYLIKSKMAEMVIHYSDASHEVQQLDAPGFNEYSDLRSLLWSDILSNWEQKKVIKVELDIYCPAIERELGVSGDILRIVSKTLNIPLKQLIKYEAKINQSEDIIPHLTVLFNKRVPNYANQCGFDPDDNCYYLTEEVLGINL